eukprot:6405221-Prymnesium_polylepis.1
MSLSQQISSAAGSSSRAVSGEVRAEGHGDGCAIRAVGKRAIDRLVRLKAAVLPGERVADAGVAVVDEEVEAEHEAVLQVGRAM